MTTSPNLHDYAWVVVNSSGGKDSQTALRFVWKLALAQDYPLDRIVVSHQDLGRMEWEGTKELAAAQAAHYNLAFEVSSYVDKVGEELSLLDYARRRKMWPSNQQRWCTSEMKRGPGNRVLTRLSRRRAGDILQVFGFRAEESPARRKRPVMQINPRASSLKRVVTDWLPIHTWTEAQVWADIRESGVASHPAYALGMPRLSCVFCIFAPEGALMISGKHNPQLLQEYITVEREIGHDFQNGKPLRLIAEALERGEQAPAISGAWNM
jgi:3'-phosphoadenosine 5'-phosphosulfate sulfotransferase (PAPS reductase)/FAD synthetase